VDYSRTDVIKWWSMVRWFIFIVLFAVGLLHLSTNSQFIPVLVFIGVFFGIMILNLLYQINTRFVGNVSTAFQIVLDLVFATMVVHLTGGLTSNFVWIYLIGVITASILVPEMGGVLAGLIGSFSLIGLVVLYQYDILIPTQLYQFDLTSRTVYILSYSALFIGVAMTASYISEQLEKLQLQVNNDREQLSALTARLSETEQILSANKLLLEQNRDLVQAACDIAHIDHDLNTPLCVISLSIGRVKRLGMEANNEQLLRTSNEVTEAINKINEILHRLGKLKTNALIRNYEEGLVHEQENISSR